MSTKMKGNLLLLLTAIIWGSGFVAQKEGGAIGSLTFNGIRTTLAGLTLLPFIIRAHRGNDTPLFNKTDLKGGIICGLLLFAAGNLQQFGIAYTTSGKAAFITTLYVVFCPILAVFVLKKRIRPIIWVCVVLECVGLYLLCMTDASFALGKGDTLVVLCAIAFSGQMTAIDIFITKVDALKLSCIQFLTSGILTMVGMVIFERPISGPEILSFWFPILYSGIISCCIGYTLQTVGQKYANATIAGLLLSLESVFAAIFGALLLNEIMTMRELSGCIIMFTAVILSNLPEKSSSAPALENTPEDK